MITANQPFFPFHRDFDRVSHEPPERWKNTYWRLDLDALPPARPIPSAIIPGDSSIRPVSRIFAGYYSRSVGTRNISPVLIHSYYETKPGWKTDWGEVSCRDQGKFLVPDLLRNDRNRDRYSQRLQVCLPPGEGDTACTRTADSTSEIIGARFRIG